ncbi:MAG: S-methyl-5-thioribose-1-phosphate isomerase [Halanaerobiales bacterium]|nr:S-methyl-5-thioribose-1-phosphate isomerase [Halanaerobiales bacterium]
MKHKTLYFEDDVLKMIDQRILPLEIKHYEAKDYQEVCEAIKKMVVRGAPAIGAAASFGYYLAVKEFYKADDQDSIKKIDRAKKDLLNTRPTAVNLSWSVKRMEKVFKNENNISLSKKLILDLLYKEVKNIFNEDIKTNKKLAEYGNKLIEKNDVILTHCNAGALATVGYGTALGVIRKANQNNKNIEVFIDETRPRLQGASLTAFEMLEEEIPATLIVDSTAATLIKNQKIDKIIVGADRIASNGDVANKIGTFMLSVIAKVYEVPFLVAAPVSTIDFDISNGNEIEVENRNKDEVTEIRSVRIAPEGIKVYNPAFDLTPAENITAIITEKGILKPPFKECIKNLT